MYLLQAVFCFSCIEVGLSVWLNYQNWDKPLDSLAFESWRRPQHRCILYLSWLGLDLVHWCWR